MIGRLGNMIKRNVAVKPEPTMRQRIKHAAIQFAIVCTVMICAYVTTSGLISHPAPQAPDRPAVTDSQAEFAKAAAAYNARATKVMKAHHCLTVAQWQKVNGRTVPARMLVHPDGTDRIVLKVWTYPAPANEWVLGLCP